MKKRILSLLLVVVMLTLTLASCAYSYSKDDMSKYATVDFEAFKKALMSGDDIKIVDGDYTTNSEINKEKVLEAINKALAKLVDADEKVKAGAVELYDMLYYNYYITASFEVKEGEETVTKEVILHSSFMKEASATSVQLGVTPTQTLNSTKAIMTEELAAAITKALKDKDIKDFLYSTDVSTGTELAVGNDVYISYTSEKGEKKTTVTYEKMTLGADDFSAKIIEKCGKVGKKAESFDIGEGDDKVSYKNVVVECIINSANELGAFKITDYFDDQDKTVTLSDVYGASYDLEDAKDGITVHVFPVYFLDTPAFTAETLLNLQYGAKLTADTLKVFKDETLKTADGKMLSDLITELANLCKDRDTAETTLDEAVKAFNTAKTAFDTANTAYETAKKAVEDAGESVTEAQTKALTEAETKKTEAETKKTEAETKKTEAETKLAEAEKKVVDKIAEITGIEGVAEKITTEYYDNNAHSLKEAYDSEIYNKVATEVWKLIDKYVTVGDTLPKKALKEAKENILNTHKTTFYTGTNSTTKESYYKSYGGDFKSYLTETLAKGKTYDDALAVIEAEAKEHVTTMVKIYALAEKYGCELKSDKEFKEAFVPRYTYDYSSYQIITIDYDYAVSLYGKDSVHASVQFDKLMNTILDYNKVDHDGHEEVGEYIEFGDEKILPFNNIRYTTTEETSEDTEG